MKTSEKFNIYVENNFLNWKVDEEKISQNTSVLLAHYIQFLSEKSCLRNMEYAQLTLSIIFCNSEKTKELNLSYRDKNNAADILTFAIFADSDTKFVLDGEINLGEIIIALDKVIEGVNRDISHSKNKEQELYFLISHGLMHLLGFDHQTEEDYNFVIEEQRKALESINYDEI